jgi:hypothetical protein
LTCTGHCAAGRAIIPAAPLSSGAPGVLIDANAASCSHQAVRRFDRDRRRFASLFLFSIPLGWDFEFANRYLDNWRYLMPRPYHPVEYLLLASLVFSTVIPAIFVTAVLLRTLTPFAPDRLWLRVDLGRVGLAVLAVIGLALFLLSLQVREGRWDSVLVLFAAGLTCGWFWEMWKVLSMPKWVYGPAQGRRGRNA